MKRSKISLLGPVATLALAATTCVAKAAPIRTDREAGGAERFGAAQIGVASVQPARDGSADDPTDGRVGQRQPISYRFVTFDDDRWRYRWYNGRWWYWVPSNRWVDYSDGGWRAYTPRGGAVWYSRSYPSRYYTGYRGYHNVDPYRYRAWSQPYYRSRTYYRGRRAF